MMDNIEFRHHLQGKSIQERLKREKEELRLEKLVRLIVRRSLAVIATKSRLKVIGLT